jgi:hypothetical protein
MAADVESDVIDIIVAGTAYVENTNLFRGPVRSPSNVGSSYPVPVNAAFVRFASGSPPTIHRTSNVQEKEWTVDIIVRGDRGNYKSARDAAQAILEVVNDSSESWKPDNGPQRHNPDQG